MNPYGVSATTVRPAQLAVYNAGVRAARLAANDHGCPVMVWANTVHAHERPCDKPIGPGARFCERHEADRIRLGGVS